MKIAGREVPFTRLAFFALLVFLLLGFFALQFYWGRSASQTQLNYWASQAQISEAGIAILAIILAVSEYWRTVRLRQEDQAALRRNTLEALRHELEFNADWASELPDKDINHKSYFDPTYALFPCRDDAITQAITSGQSGVLTDAELVKKLLAVSYAVRFVNAQIKGELNPYRFGSPQTLSEMTRWWHGLSDDQKAKYVEKPEDIRGAEGDFLRGLRLRHWAVVNEGGWKRLWPALLEARDSMNAALQKEDLELLTF